MNNIFVLLKQFFNDRRVYVKHNNIFLPSKAPKILVFCICSILPIIALICGAFSINTFDYEYFTGIAKLFFIVFLFFIGLYFLFLANHIVIDNGYIKNTEYLFKVKRIKIAEIKSCSVTTGRARGEAMYNLKIKSDNDVININMFIYSMNDLKKIVASLGFPDAIQYKEKRVLTESEKKKKKQERKKSVKKILNVLISIFLIAYVTPILLFTLSYYLEINGRITKIILFLPIVIGWKLSPFFWKKTKKYSLRKMIILGILSIIIYCLIFFISGSLYSYLRFGHI